MTRVVVGMPWRPKPGRLAAHDTARAWWDQHFPSYEVVEVDTEHDQFNLAACRNAAVRAAEGMGAEVVVITDADVIFHPVITVDQCIDAARDGRVHMPFTEQVYLTEDETEALVSGRPAPTSGAPGNGCCYIATPAAYWAAGGGDERFQGWGGDDDAFVAASETLVGLRRHEGLAYSLWHPAVRDIGSDRWRPNSDLAQRYWRARGSVRHMKRLIATRPPQ